MPLHTVEEAAELMKVSPDTVREWVRSGRLRASKLAGSKTLRISTDDIMAFYDATIVVYARTRTHTRTTTDSTMVGQRENERSSPFAVRW